MDFRLNIAKLHQIKFRHLFDTSGGSVVAGENEPYQSRGGGQSFGAFGYSRGFGFLKMKAGKKRRKSTREEEEPEFRPHVRRWFGQSLVVWELCLVGGEDGWMERNGGRVMEGETNYLFGKRERRDGGRYSPFKPSKFNPSKFGRIVKKTKYIL
uniref:Uncharacterized protein n=1 Tax=Cannabis sativa TaxID=3483 RepID=A0A803PYT1_CANSA